MEIEKTGAELLPLPRRVPRRAVPSTQPRGRSRLHRHEDLPVPAPHPAALQKQRYLPDELIPQATGKPAPRADLDEPPAVPAAPTGRRRHWWGRRIGAAPRSIAAARLRSSSLPARWGAADRVEWEARVGERGLEAGGTTGLRGGGAAACEVANCAIHQRERGSFSNCTPQFWSRCVVTLDFEFGVVEWSSRQQMDEKAARALKRGDLFYRCFWVFLLGSGCLQSVWLVRCRFRITLFFLKLWCIFLFILWRVISITATLIMLLMYRMVKCTHYETSKKWSSFPEF